MGFLAMMLDSPMQSWGYQSQYSHQRTTLSYPTKSGVLGLICAAMGVGRDDQKKLQELRGLLMTTYTFGDPEVCTDFHTIGHGTSRGDAGFLRKMDRKAANRTVITHRSYLLGVRFGVVLEGDDSLLDEAEQGLVNPRWGVWLGRKCCLPTMPIFQGRFTSFQDASDHLKGINDPSECIPRLLTKSVKEVSGASGDYTRILRDTPLDFEGRSFGPRFVDDNPDI